MNGKVVQQPVTEEYTRRRKGVRTTLSSSYTARAFYKRMDKQGRQPRVVYRGG
jgi:hypothetical protein